MSTTVGILGGAAAVGFLGAFWSKIKMIFSRIISLFIVSVKVNNKAATAVAIYCWENMKRSPFGNRCYSSKNDYIRPLKRYQHFAYEYFGKDPVLFWQGWRVLLLGYDGGEGDNAPREDSLTFTFIRGTWDIDALLVKALDVFNERCSNLYDKEKDSHKRFRVYRIFGEGNRARSGEPKTGYVEGVEEKEAYDVSMGDKRLLKWIPDQIGPEKTENGSAFDSLAYPDEVMDLVEEVRRWKNSEKWYRDKKIPYKRGWGLHGGPGTGKTALVRATAEDLDLPVWQFDMATLANYEFVEAWRRMLRRVPCVALLEDVDNIFNERENVTGEEGDRMTFDVLLNCIDGVEKADGVFTVITTNKLEKVDAALGIPSKRSNGSALSTRPGRIDRILELKEMDETCRRKLAGRILSEWPDVQQKTIEEGDGDTGAQFQYRCSRLAEKLYWEEKANV